MFRKSQLVVALCVLAVPFAARIDAAGTVLVVPSRYTVLQFAFDIDSLRDVSLVAYEPGAGTAGPTLHVWDKGVGDWVRMAVPDFEAAVGLPEQVAGVCVVGETVPEVLAKAPSWGVSYELVPSLDLSVLANSLHKTMSFSDREWRWLSSRYDLRLEDRNRDRRRFGKYGRDGKSAPGQRKHFRLWGRKSDEEPVDELRIEEDLEPIEIAEPAIDEAVPDPAAPEKGIPGKGVAEKGVPEVTKSLEEIPLDAAPMVEGVSGSTVDAADK